MRSNGQHTGPLSRRELLAGCATLGAAGLGGCLGGSLDETETVTQEHDGADIGRVGVATPDGEVELRGVERETIQVAGTKRAADEDALNDITLEAEHDGDTLSLTAEVDDSDGLLSLEPSPRMDLAVEVPETRAVEAETTNGDVNCELPAPDAVGVRTTNGNVNCTAGDPGTVSARTVNGDISLFLDELADVTAETTNGDVTITVPASAEPEVSFETTNGSLDITGLDAASLDVDSTVETTIGDGTHRIAVETTNGDFRLQGRS